MNDQQRAKLIEKVSTRPVLYGHVEVASARSACRVCFSGTWCCRHAKYHAIGVVSLRRVECVCGLGCKLEDFTDG